MFDSIKIQSLTAAIVPQLCKPARGAAWFRPQAAGVVLLALVAPLCWAAAPALPVPEVPVTVEQAKAVLPKLDGLEARYDLQLDKEVEACYDRILVSNCLRDTRNRRAEMKRRIRVVNNTARELIRVDDLQKRQAEKADKIRKDALGQPEREKEQADRKAAFDRKAADIEARQSKLPQVRLRGERKENPDSVLPAPPTVEEQKASRQAFENKQEEARERKAANDKRLQALEQKRENIRKQQAEASK